VYHGAVWILWVAQDWRAPTCASIDKLAAHAFRACRKPHSM
jgi:hypothetical protein